VDIMGLTMLLAYENFYFIPDSSEKHLIQKQLTIWYPVAEPRNVPITKNTGTYKLPIKNPEIQGGHALHFINGNVQLSTSRVY